MSGWKFEITDNGGVGVGEPLARSRSFSPAVSGVASASFQIKDTDPLWSVIAPGSHKLKVFDSAGNLQLYGPIVSEEEVGDGQGSTVTYTAADQAWEFGKRYVGKDQAGVGVLYTSQDSGVIALDGLSRINAEQATGVVAGNHDAFVTRTITALWKRYLDMLSELGAIAGSYEWALRYVDGAPPQIFLDLKSSLGNDRTQSVFLEYGAGKLTGKGYSRTRSIDNQATRVWVLGGASTQAPQAFDASAEALYAARREDVISYSDVTVTSLLDALAAAHVAIRKDPQTVVTVVPFPKNSARYGVDYVVGDTVTARVLIRNKVRVNGAVRVWGGSISLDESGNEIPTLQLTPS